MFIHARSQVKIRKKCPPSCLFLESKQILQPAFVFSRLYCSTLSSVLLRVPLHCLFFSWKGWNKHNHQLSQHSNWFRVIPWSDGIFWHRDAYYFSELFAVLSTIKKEKAHFNMEIVYPFSRTRTVVCEFWKTFNTCLSLVPPSSFNLIYITQHIIM